MKIYKLLFGAVVILSTVGCDDQKKDEQDLMPSLKTEFNLRMDSVLRAWNSNDLPGLAGFFTEDARILGTDPTEELSKKEFEKLYGDMLEQGFTGAQTLQSNFIQVSPDFSNVVTTLHVIFPGILKNIQLRSSYNWIKTEKGWKCNYFNLSVVPLNQNLAALDSIIGLRR